MTFFRFKRYVFMSLLFAGAVNILATDNPAPTGADLLHACTEAMASGFNSSKGMLCIWYVTPCDCEANNTNDLPRVCLPADVSHERLADQVVQELRQAPQLLNLSAEAAAANILAPVYPCGDESRNN